MTTVRDWVLSGWQSDQGEYSKSVQMLLDGTYVHDWDNVGLPPVQFEGEAVVTVRVWVLSLWQSDQSE